MRPRLHRHDRRLSRSGHRHDDPAPAVRAVKKIGNAITRGRSGLDLSDEELDAAAARQNAIDDAASAYGPRSGGEGMGGDAGGGG